MKQTTYTNQQLADEFDVTPRTVRFYEEIGLLQPVRSSRSGGGLVYSPRDRTRLKLILRAKQIGLTLSDARALIEMFDGPKDTRPQLERYVEVLAEHRQVLEQRLVDLKDNIRELKLREKQAIALLGRLSG